MKKAERNDPCPCGSGKKYKKCCLEKDELERDQELLAALAQPVPNQYTQDGWEREEEDILDDWDENEEENEDMDEGPDEDWDAMNDDIHADPLDFDELDEPADELPEISAEDNKLVDDWWEEYKKMKDTVQERKHLVAFMEKYPHLVEHLELHMEVLFEIGNDHYKKGIYETFVELLLRIREEHPNVYKKSFGYYDLDMICWYVAQGRLDEIHLFFDRFKQDLDPEFDYKLDEVICFLRATNHSDILVAELAKRTIVPIIINNTVARYLDKPVSNESVKELMDELASEGIDPKFIGETTDWNERLLRYVRPFSPWKDLLPKKRSQAMKYYLAITENFTYFLYKETDLSFDSAHYYANAIYQYFLEAVSFKRYPKDVFCLDKETIKDNLFVTNFGWLDSNIPCFAQLNAFYYFAAYLETCGNITEQQKREFQKFITEIYRDYYSKSKNSGPETLSFQQFPLWEMKV